MYRILIVTMLILLNSCETDNAQQSYPSVTANISPEMLRMRVFQMQMGTKKVEEWPKEQSGLFQGLRKKLPFIVSNESDHLKAISTIPDYLWTGYKVNETKYIDGWFYSSIKSANGTEPDWSQLIAIKQNTNLIYFSYTW